jgi:hypothetical protein
MDVVLFYDFPFTFFSNFATADGVLQFSISGLTFAITVQLTLNLMRLDPE